jgi:cell division cycle 20-like protein 1 (cofactor of APC complex)
MNFLPDRFIRKADPNLFSLKQSLAQQNNGCRVSDITTLMSETSNTPYEDALTDVFYGMPFNDLVSRPVFGKPLAERRILPCEMQHPLKISRSQVQNAPFFKMVRVLDAPGLEPDFYSSPLSCHPANPAQLAVALGSKILVHDFESKRMPQVVCDFRDEAGMRPNVVKWSISETLAIGTRNGSFQCYDMELGRLFRKIYTHSREGDSTHHVSAMALRGRDGFFVGNHASDLVQIDLRASHSRRMALNIGPICNLACRESILLAGGDDNVMRVYDTRAMADGNPLYSFAHNAAVRALSFLPGNRDVCVTGGGLADKTIRLYDIKRGKQLCQVEVHAQVSNILALEENSFISTHGFGGKPYANSVVQWQYQEGASGAGRIVPKKVLDVMPSRVVYADRCASEGGQERFLTASSDETIRVWRRDHGSKEHGDEPPLEQKKIR